ncbi:MAG: helix-hairpin-helix domain-containing protein [Planctomycetota bacterium]|nr:helix-hairpin-helix domain-containing protein [Planctomycetota bacterium]
MHASPNSTPELLETESRTAPAAQTTIDQTSNPSAIAHETVRANLRLPREAAAALPLQTIEESDLDRPSLGLRQSDRRFVFVLLFVLLVLSVIDWFRVNGGRVDKHRVENRSVETYEYRLNVNAATQAEWSLLDGIGPHLAHEIVRDREENGPFEAIDDLQRVRGIGPIRLASVRPHLQSIEPVNQKSETRR